MKQFQGIDDPSVTVNFKMKMWAGRAPGIPHGPNLIPLPHNLPLFDQYLIQVSVNRGISLLMREYHRFTIVALVPAKDDFTRLRSMYRRPDSIGYIDARMVGPSLRKRIDAKTHS